MKTCKKCGYQWTPRKKIVKCCPKCKRYDWEEKRRAK